MLRINCPVKIRWGSFLSPLKIICLSCKKYIHLWRVSEISGHLVPGPRPHVHVGWPLLVRVILVSLKQGEQLEKNIKKTHQIVPILPQCLRWGNEEESELCHSIEKDKLWLPDCGDWWPRLVMFMQPPRRFIDTWPQCDQSPYLNTITT